MIEAINLSFLQANIRCVTFQPLTQHVSIAINSIKINIHLQTSRMGIGIAWGNMEDGCMGLKHISWHVTCFGGSGCLGIKTCVGSLVEMWYVLVGGRFQGSTFEVHVLWRAIFNWSKRTSKCHQNMTCFHVGCSEAHSVYTWKPTLSRLEMSDTFKTHCWNNVGRL